MFWCREQKGVLMDRQAGKRAALSGRLALVAVLSVTIMALALGVAACSMSNAIIGKTTTTGPTTTTTTATSASTGDSSTSRTSSTRFIEGGKTVEEYAAEIPDLQKAVEANPTDLTALQNLAVAQYNSRHYDDAIATYQKMLQIKDDPVIHNNYGNVLRDQSKFDEATTQYRKAIAGDPSMAIAYINLAGIYDLQGNYPEAQRVLDEGIARTVGDDRTRLENYKIALAKKK